MGRIHDMSTMVNIRCAICDKQVERTEICADVYRDLTQVSVWCHGERDTCELPRDFDPKQMLEATAFTTKRLNPAPEDQASLEKFEET